jgi:hypothetical protein
MNVAPVPDWRLRTRGPFDWRRHTHLMKNFVLAVLMILAGSNPLSASLGGRADTSDDRYGDIVERRLLDDGRLNIVYHSGRYLYSVILANGRSVLERYSHFNGRGLSPKEIDKFLKANSGGATWVPDSTLPEKRYKRSDGRAEATYDEVSGRLALTVRQLHADRSRTDQ